MADWSPAQIDRYDKMLVLEAANELPPDALAKLNALREAGEVPDLPAWQPDHPHIQAAEQKYGLPKGTLSALATIESSGNPQAVSPTNVTGLFQVTRDTGAPYGLTTWNRTNPYLNTDVAARHFKDLLDETGSVEGALARYKGPEISDAEYIERFNKAFQQYSGAPASQADTAIQSTITPGVTTTPTSKTFAQGVRQRAGFGDNSAQATGLLGQVAQNLDSGPMGPLLRMLGIPSAVVGESVERATGSPGAGTAAQVGSELVVPTLAARAGGRVIRSLLPRGRAARELSMVREGITSAENRARLLTDASTRAKREAERLASTRLPGQVDRAVGGAQTVAQQAAEDLARQGANAPIPRHLTQQLDALARNPSGRTPSVTREEWVPDGAGSWVPKQVTTPGQRVLPIRAADVPADLVAARQAVQQMGSRVSDFQKVVERVAAPGVSPANKLKLLEEGSNIIKRDIPGLEDAVATRLLIEETLANATKLREAAKAAGASGGDLAKRAAELERFLASESVTQYLARKGMQLTKAGIVVDIYRRLSSGPRGRDE
jgi:hypothetical protein